MKVSAKMGDGFRNKPKKLRGAFVEFGLSIPPLILPFQFNPEQITRSRNLSYLTKGAKIKEEVADRYESSSLSQMHKNNFLWDVQEKQKVIVNEESINFDLHLDAADELNEGDVIAGYAGISPRLATLELMTKPKDDGFLSGLLESGLSSVLGAGNFSFISGEKPPMMLFIWGPARILPVNINSISITEKEFNTLLSPVRATVSVNMTVIEGNNIPYQVTTTVREVLSALNLANIADVADVVVPG